MILVLAAFPVLAFASAQVPQVVDSLRSLAAHGSDSALVAGVRQNPTEARAAWTRFKVLVAASGGEDSTSLAALAAAERLAAAVAVASGDSFLVRQVARFRALTAGDRRATAEADSVFQMGRDAG